MTPNEAIEIMCRRCINYEICSGTGCEPKRTLETHNTSDFIAKIDEAIVDLDVLLINNKLTISATSDANVIIRDMETGEERVYKDLGYPI